MKKPTHYLTYCTLILLGGALLRLWHLGQAGLWLDENFTAFFAHASSAQFFDFLLIDTVHVPFYFMMMRLLPGEPEVLLRLPSAFLGILSIAVTMRAIDRLYGNPRWGLWAGALLAFNPHHIWYSRSARPYALFVLVTIAASFCFLRLLQGHRSRTLWIMFTVTSMGAYMTHYFALALPLAQYITLAFVLRGDALFFRRWFLSQFIAGVPLLVWIGALTRQEILSDGTAWIPPLTLDDPLVTLWNLMVGYVGQDTAYYLPAIVIASGALLVGMRYALRQRKADVPALFSVWVILGALIPVTLISQFRAIYHDRYFIVMVPALLLLVLHGMRQYLPERRAEIALLLLMAFGVITVIIRIANDEEEREDWQAASVLVERNFVAGDQLLLNGGMLLPFNRYKSDSFEPPTIEIEFEDPPLLKSGQRMWVLMRNPNESLHSPFRMPDFDPFGYDEPLSKWLQANRTAFVEQWAYPGVTVLLFIAP